MSDVSFYADVAEKFPCSSCEEIHRLNNRAPSGEYTIRTSTGKKKKVRIRGSCYFHSFWIHVGGSVGLAAGIPLGYMVPPCIEEIRSRELQLQGSQ